MDVVLLVLLMFCSLSRAYVAAVGRTVWVFSRALCDPIPALFERTALFFPPWITALSVVSTALGLYTTVLGWQLHGMPGLVTVLVAQGVCTFAARRLVPPSCTVHYQAPCLQRVADHLYRAMRSGDRARAVKMRAILVRAGIRIEEIPALITAP